MNAQQAADAAMVEIRHASLKPQGNIIVNPHWLRTFLANYIEGLFGGEQAGQLLQRASSAEGVTGTDTQPGQVPATPDHSEIVYRQQMEKWGSTYCGGEQEQRGPAEHDNASPSGRTPATPIDTEDLRLKISMAARGFALQEYMAAVRGEEMTGPDYFDQELREILDPVLAQPVDEWPTLGKVYADTALAQQPKSIDTEATVERLLVVVQTWADKWHQLMQEKAGTTEFFADQLATVLEMNKGAKADIRAALAQPVEVLTKVTGFSEREDFSESVEVCEWRVIDGGWQGACGCYGQSSEGMTKCFCGKPIREVPFEEVSGDEQ